MPKQQKRQPDPWPGLAGAGIQMGATIFLGNWLGEWLDQKFQKDFIETTGTLFAIVAAIYLLIKQVNRINR